MQPSSAEASEALASVRASQAKLLTAATCPPERHLAFAALMTGLVACPAAPYPVMFAIEALILVGVGLVVAWDRRRTGMFVNGYRAGKTRWVTFPILIVELAMVAGGYWMAKGQGVTWVPLALAVPAFVTALGGSVLWGRVWKRELTGQA